MDQNEWTLDFSTRVYIRSCTDPNAWSLVYVTESCPDGEIATIELVGGVLKKTGTINPDYRHNPKVGLYSRLVCNSDTLAYALDQECFQLW